MGRQPCCDGVGLKRGQWTVDEDQKLTTFILNNGIHCWRLVPKLSGLLRCGKSCRLRWTNYLRPDLKRGAFSDSDDDQIILLHSRLGNRWSKIASRFPGRTDNEIKNHWNTRIKKRMRALGLDHVTHHPIQPEPDLNSGVAGGDGDDGNAADAAAEREEEELTRAKASSSGSAASLSEPSLENDICWDATIDSFPSWDAFNFLEDVLSFVNYP